jgi:uncharacterized protein YlaI
MDAPIRRFACANCGHEAHEKRAGTDHFTHLRQVHWHFHWHHFDFEARVDSQHSPFVRSSPALRGGGEESSPAPSKRNAKHGHNGKPHLH